MHGIGNDYIYVNCFEEQADNPSELARKISNRHFGVGGDGLILVKPSGVADCKMEIYNADGSEGEMCGNGIRCVAKYVYDTGIVKSTDITVETKAGIKELKCHLKNRKVDTVSVNMGTPIIYNPDFTVPLEILSNNLNSNLINKPPDYFNLSHLFLDTSKINNLYNNISQINQLKIHLTLISMGNPHAVIFIQNEKYLDSLELGVIGPLFENYKAFPNRINTEFVTIKDKNHIKMRVWERGSGETLACGTGACASVAASVMHNLIDKSSPVTVSLLGGELEIIMPREKNEIIMTGKAACVFEGDIYYS